ncbi:21983_t:CDS:2, partial [Dentiscutata erythropus]
MKRDPADHYGTDDQNDKVAIVDQVLLDNQVIVGPGCGIYAIIVGIATIVVGQSYGN